MSRTQKAVAANAGDDADVTRSSIVIHELKCWPKFFRAIKEGRKTHDLRRADDRMFCVGDRLVLREYDPSSCGYTGRRMLVEVTYVTSAELPCALSSDALDPSFAILSIRLVK
jgi:hypothetical protein